MGQTPHTAWNAGLQTGTAALRAAYVVAPRASRTALERRSPDRHRGAKRAPR